MTDTQDEFEALGGVAGSGAKARPDSPAPQEAQATEAAAYADAQTVPPQILKDEFALPDIPTLRKEAP